MKSFINREQYKVGDKIGGELSVLKVFGGEGKSGMGVVYLVKDPKTLFPFVLKTFQHRPRSETASQFISEANAWIQAGAHVNIVQAFWVREIDGQLFIAAEYVENDSEGRNTVKDYITTGNVPNEIITNWGVQFCYGMEYAIGKGLMCHRDIKPDNLMVDPNLTLKITDFGLAKLEAFEVPIAERKRVWRPLENNKEKNGDVLHTKTGTALGTAPYMAPEQFLDAKNADHRADIYSFGIVLYEMVSGGDYPYNITESDFSNPMVEFAKLHLHAKPIKIDSPLMEIVQRCLEKHRDNRYESYLDLLSDFQRIAKDRRILIVSPPEQGSSEDEELYAKAQSYVALKKPGKALEAIETYVIKFPNRYCGWTEKSRIHLERNEPDQAVEAAKTSLSLYPYNSHAWNNLGLALARQRIDLGKAKEAYEKAIKYDQQNTGAMANLSILLQELSEYDRIAHLIVKAITLRPEKETLCFNAGNIAAFLMKDNRVSDARVILEALLKVSPNNLNAWHNLALINWQEKSVIEAIKCFESVVRLNPSDDFAWLALAKLYFGSKKAKETVRCCNRLLKMGKSITDAVSMTAQVINFTGNYPGAVELIESYLKRQPENDTWCFVLSEIHEFRENQEAALEAAMRCKSILIKYSKNANPENIKYVEDKIDRIAGKRKPN